MATHSDARKTKVYYKRRPRRLSAVERVVERAEDRFDIRELARRRRDPENEERIPWEQVKKELGLE
jgi:hypothetical protein